MRLARQRIKQLGSDAGMTLVEMVVAITLFMLILGAALSALDSGTNAERGQQARHDALLELRQAMTQLTKELRQATAIDPDSTNRLLEIDTLVSGVPTHVIYEQVGTDTLHLERRVGASAQTLVTNMVPTDPAFCYSYDSLTETCIDAGRPPPIATAIRITLAKDPEFNPGEPVTLATDVQLRNL